VNKREKEILNAWMKERKREREREREREGENGDACVWRKCDRTKERGAVHWGRNGTDGITMYRSPSPS